MFSPQTYIQQETDQTGRTKMKRNASPRIGILGAQTFSVDGSAARKLENQPSNTVNKTIKSIEVSLIKDN